VRDVAADLPRFLTAPLFRRWHRTWRATPAEVADGMPGDELFPRAQYRSTRAITIAATPGEVWPWLVQDLEVGRRLPMTPAPSETTTFVVDSFEGSRRMSRGIRERAQAEHRRRVPPPIDAHRLALIRGVHTATWFSIESCVAYLLWSGATGRSDRRAGLAAAVVAGECLVFAAAGFRCPMTGLAERAGAASGSVTDIYLPTWFAKNLPAIHVPLLALIGWLHGRTLRRGRTSRQPTSTRRGSW
jgi:hypothetical protein